MDIEEIKREMKLKKKHKIKKNIKYGNHLSCILITILLVLICLITFKIKPDLKDNFYKHVYEDNFKFIYFKKIYDKYFKEIVPNTMTKNVFNEALNYESATKYEDGCSLKVAKNYLIPAIDSGMVVYIGDKDKLGNTIIVQGINGNDIWYGNVSSASVKLYDYIEKGSLIGETKDDKLYLVFKKDGKILNYEDYI